MQNVSLKLGTRRSLLAWTQSGWVAAKVEALNPGVKVELVGIETRGDQIQNVPLSSIEGKEFFVAELDQALRSGAVDFCVHSLKDLSLTRPPEFCLAAIPEREESRDFLFLEKSVASRLAKGEPVEIKIGTSSPRRIEVTLPFVRELFPKAKVSAVEIRGNVNTRLARVSLNAPPERRLEGVILAAAGINRLMGEEKAKAEINPLLDAVIPIALPLIECPSAPGQGALAVECRAKDPATLAVLSRLHDAETARGVTMERAVLAEWGGGCHQALGASRILHKELPGIFSVRGMRDSGERVVRLEGLPSKPAGALDVGADPTIGVKTQREWLESEQARALALLTSGKIKTLWLAHSAALQEASELESLVKTLSARGGLRVIVAGTTSWKKLLSRGILAIASSEGLGMDATMHETGLLRSAQTLGLGDPSSWLVLTHEGALDSERTDPLRVGHQIGTYRLKLSCDEAGKERMTQAKELYWSSFSLFSAFGNLCRNDATHYCGAGKTSEKLRGLGLTPRIVK